MGLQVWLPLNGNLNQQGLADVTVTNNGATVSTSGKIGSCYSFDGSDDFISLESTALYSTIQGSTHPFSIAFWVYHADSSRAVLFGDYSLPGGINFNIELSAAHAVRFYWAGSPDKYLSGVVATSGWTHVAIVYDCTDLKYYKDGVLSDTYTVTLTQKNKTSGVYYLGRDYRTGSTALNGRLNDFRIYDHALSPLEVKRLAQGLVLHYPLNRGGFGGDNILPNTWAGERTFEYPSSSYYDRWSCVTSIVPTASQYTLSFWAKSTVAGDQIRTHFYSPNTTTTCVSSQGITKQASDGNMTFTLSTEWEHYWVTYSQNETSAVKHVICPRMGAVGNTQGICYGTGTVSIKGLKLEEGSVATPWVPATTDPLYSAMGLDSNVVYDVSGYGHNGTKTGTFAYDADTPRYNTSTIFNGNNHIAVGRLLITDELTYNWWAYSDNWGESLGGSMMSSIEGGGMGHQNGGSTYLWFALGTGEASNNYGSAYRMPTPSAGWHMFTETWDGYRFKVYLDGELKFTNERYTTKTPVYYSQGYNFLFIGGESGGSATTPGDHFIGKLSDARIYATALSAEDVMNLYHTPISLANNGALLTQGEFVES